jgi:hypothetical protein
MLRAACLDIGLFIIPFTIKHPLKEKIHGTASDIGSLIMRALQHSAKKVMDQQPIGTFSPIVFLAVHLVEYPEVYTRHAFWKSTQQLQTVQRKAGI